jgi:UDP-N-acetylmuramate dehydrogenase
VVWVLAVQPQLGVALAPRTTLGVGGPAAYFVQARDEAAALHALSWAERHGVPCRILGGGSNVVVADAGYPGLVLQLATQGITVRPSADRIELVVAAGENWDEFVEHTVQQGYAGLECLSGSPGSVGATPIQNVGAYGQEVGSCISRVRAYDRRRREIVELSQAACHFGYRDSLFRSAEPDRYLVLDVGFQLAPAGAPRFHYRELKQQLVARGIRSPTPLQVRESVLALRRSKSMLLAADDPNRRNCGSFFVNPVVESSLLTGLQQQLSITAIPHYGQPDGRVKLSAGWLIEQAGFRRGTRQGNVGLSTSHALALVCYQDARAHEVVGFARQIRARVEQQFRVRLMPEPAFWGFASLDDGLPDDRLA